MAKTREIGYSPTNHTQGKEEKTGSNHKPGLDEICNSLPSVRQTGGVSEGSKGSKGKKGKVRREMIDCASQALPGDLLSAGFSPRSGEIKRLKPHEFGRLRVLKNGQISYACTCTVR